MYQVSKAQIRNEPDLCEKPGLMTFNVSSKVKETGLKGVYVNFASDKM